MPTSTTDRTQALIDRYAKASSDAQKARAFAKQAGADATKAEIAAGDAYKVLRREIHKRVDARVGKLARLDEVIVETNEAE